MNIRPEIIVNAALKNWEKDHDYLRQTPQGGYIEPLQDYILHIAKAVELILNKKTTPENLESKLEEMGRMVKTTRQFRAKQMRELKDFSYGNTEQVIPRERE